jgi:hypothetical protein
MRRLLLVLVMLQLSGPVWASHPWGGVDLCATRPDLVPPGIEPEQLPAPDSTGARLLQAYCAQCHKLPEPALHDRESWPAVVERMEFLMRVSHLYRGELGPVDMPDAAQWVLLQDYLHQHAATEPPARVESPPDDRQPGRWLSLAVFFGLATLGLWRWRTT